MRRKKARLREMHRQQQVLRLPARMSRGTRYISHRLTVSFDGTQHRAAPTGRASTSGYYGGYTLL